MVSVWTVLGLTDLGDLSNLLPQDLSNLSPLFKFHFFYLFGLKVGTKPDELLFTAK